MNFLQINNCKTSSSRRILLFALTNLLAPDQKLNSPSVLWRDTLLSTTTRTWNLNPFVCVAWFVCNCPLDKNDYEFFGMWLPLFEIWLILYSWRSWHDPPRDLQICLWWSQCLSYYYLVCLLLTSCKQIVYQLQFSSFRCCLIFIYWNYQWALEVVLTTRWRHSVQFTLRYDCLEWSL